MLSKYSSELTTSASTGPLIKSIGYGNCKLFCFSFLFFFFEQFPPLLVLQDALDSFWDFPSPTSSINSLSPNHVYFKENCFTINIFIVNQHQFFTWRFPEEISEMNPGTCVSPK